MSLKIRNIVTNRFKTFLKQKNWWIIYFYASAPKVPEALCFRVVSPSIRPSGSPSGFFRQTWYRGPPPGVDELIRFWARSAQRQGSKVNELGLNMLFYPVYAIFKYYLMEFHQTWYRGAPLGVDEQIRFWARSAQRQGSKVNELGLNMLFFPVYAITQVLLDGISSNLVQGCTTRSRWTDSILGEIRPTSRVKGQWTWSKYVIFPPLTRNLKIPWVDFHQTWYGVHHWE